MANLIKTNLFCKNKEDFKELLILLIQYGVLSQTVTMEALDMETNSISFCSNWNVPFERIKTLSELVNFDFYIEHAGDTVVDGVGEAVYHNGEVIDGADFYDDDSLDIARVFFRINGQDHYRYDQTSGEIVYIGGKSVDDDPDLAVIDTTSEILDNFLSKPDSVKYKKMATRCPLMNGCLSLPIYLTSNKTGLLGIYRVHTFLMVTWIASDYNTLQNKLKMRSLLI